MTPARAAVRKPLWFLIPLRVLLVTALVALLTFAVTLLLGIAGIVIGAKARGGTPNLPIAYRGIALPSAAVIGVLVLISSIVIEIRHYREAKALASIERAS